jgi:hypothetical protein
MEHDVSDGRTAPNADETVVVGGAADGAAVLSPSATTAMRRLLTTFREGWVLDGRVRDTARLIAEDAHRAGLDAVRMIVAVRAGWPQLDELRRIVPDDARALMSRLISCAIEEFYLIPPTGRPAEPLAPDDTPSGGSSTSRSRTTS